MRNVWNDCFHRFLSPAKTRIILFLYLGICFFAKIRKNIIENNGLFAGEKDGSRLNVDTRNINELCSDC